METVGFHSTTPPRTGRRNVSADRREGSGRGPSAPWPAATALGGTRLQRQFTAAAIDLARLDVWTTNLVQRGQPADKPTPSKQKQARTASHTAALSDMRKHGLSENGGSTEPGDSLRNLTP